MKVAFMSFSCPQASLSDVVQLAQLHDYEGFEPRVESGHAHKIELALSQAERQQVKTMMEDHQLELCCLALGSSFVDPKTVAAQVEKTLRYLELASDLGIARLRVFGGRLPEGLSRDQGQEHLIKALRQLAPQAQARGLSICLETHDDWCDPHHVAEVMRAVDHPAIAVNWDVMHPVRAAGVSMTEAFETLQPWIKHVHVHDGENTLAQLKMLPLGTGDFDNRKAITLLKTMHYDGFISGEWIESTMAASFFASHLGSERATLSLYEAEA